jgi:hypothetical protein
MPNTRSLTAASVQQVSIRRCFSFGRLADFPTSLSG